MSHYPISQSLQQTLTQPSKASPHFKGPPVMINSSARILPHAIDPAVVDGNPTVVAQ